MASDFSIAQFRYLEQLLLIHGSWCYKRIAHMVFCFLVLMKLIIFLLLIIGIQYIHMTTHFFRSAISSTRTFSLALHSFIMKSIQRSQDKQHIMTGICPYSMSSSHPCQSLH